MKSLKLGTLGLAALLTFACSAESNQDVGASEQQALSVGTGLAAVRSARAVRTDDELGQRLGGLIRALKGPRASSALAINREAVDIPGRAIQERVEGESTAVAGVFTRYESLDDSVEVFDNTPFSMEASHSDVSASAATEILKATYKSLVSEGLISEARVRLKDLTVREVHAAEGDQGGLRRSWVDEYSFFLPSNINGIRVGNYSKEYGLTINVHRSGQVRRIEISGLAIAAGESGSAVKVRDVKAAVRSKSAESVARGRIGNSQVNSLGRRYVVDEDKGTQELVPRELLRVVPEHVDGNGALVQSKAFVVSHAVDDASDAVLFSPEPGKVIDPGDTRPSE